MPRTGPEFPPPKEFDPDIESWERQSWESDVDWRCFEIYRDLAYPNGHTHPISSTKRTIAAAFLAAQAEGIYAADGRTDPSMHKATRRRCIVKRWRERCTAFDRHLAKVRLEAKAKLIEENERALADLGKKMLQVVQLEIGKLLQLSAEDVRSGRHKPRLAPKDISAITRTVISALRAGEGRSPDAIDVEHSGKTYSELIRAAHDAAKKYDD